MCRFLCLGDLRVSHVWTVVVVGADDYEYSLVRDLMRNYDMRIRPSKNSSESLNVTFGLALAQIIDVVSQRMYPPLSVVLLASFGESLSRGHLPSARRVSFAGSSSISTTGLLRWVIFRKHDGSPSLGHLLLARGVSFTGSSSISMAGLHRCVIFHQHGGSPSLGRLPSARRVSFTGSSSISTAGLLRWVVFHQHGGSPSLG